VHHPRRRLRFRVSAPRRSLAGLLVGLAAVTLSSCGNLSVASVDVFPVPGSRVAPPRTQIAFRGVPVDRLGRITVIGTRTGRHRGRVVADSDGRGGSFLPNRPFAPGETVTVRVAGALVARRSHVARFRVADPAPAFAPMPVRPASRVPGDVDSFRSRPDLRPPSVEIVHPAARSAGDVFIANQNGPLQNGTMILDADGNLIWFHPVPDNEQASDFRVQRYHGRPVLTWWQGALGPGVGMGEDEIYDSSYQRVAVVRAAGGLAADLHEFQLTPNGTALITAFYPVRWDASAAHGDRQAIVLDSVVQEIDVATGLLLFQWDSLDHVPLTDSEQAPPSHAGQPYDYFHVNSVEDDDDGSLIISARNTWAAYKVSHRTGRVIWRLGGKRSSFRMGPGAQFAFQHDVRVDGRDDGLLTIFDDGAGPPTVHKRSRGLVLKLNTHTRTATVAREFTHSPDLLANFEGNFQSLPDGDIFLGWGQQPYFTEFAADGATVFDGRFTGGNSSYRAYRFPWTGTPRTRPAVAALKRGSNAIVFASWNGATEVAGWRALSGASADRLTAAQVVPKDGFETELSLPYARYVAVEALDASGRVLGRSAVVAVG